jgi:hypothetical protein
LATSASSNRLNSADTLSATAVKSQVSGGVDIARVFVAQADEGFNHIASTNGRDYRRFQSIEDRHVT